MKETKRPFILMLEDDADDRFITQTMLREGNYDVRLEFVSDGNDLMSRLERCHLSTELPSLIILDKNLPGKSGIEILKEIKSDNRYVEIPVVVISGSLYQRDVNECYRLGASSFIQQPSTDRHTKERIELFMKYWFETVCLPQHEGAGIAEHS